MCGSVPKLMDDAQFKKCHKGPKGMGGKKGMKMREGGKSSSEEEGPRGMNMRRGGDEAGEARPDSVNGEGAASRGGKRGGKKSRQQRDANKYGN
jgi:hypothetical protein